MYYSLLFRVVLDLVGARHVINSCNSIIYLTHGERADTIAAS